MKISNDFKILNIVNTPFELYYLSSVAYLLKEREPRLKFNLWIRKEHQNKISPEIADLYSEIRALDFPNLTFPLSKNPIKLVLNAFKNLKKTLEFQKFLKSYSWSEKIINISSFREFFANMICKNAPSRIRLIALRMANQGLEELKNYKKRPILSFILNIKNFFFGYSLMEYKFRTDVKMAAEKKFIKYPYHRTILITDHDYRKEGKNWRLPSPFIALKRLYKSNLENQAQGILVAGERIPLYTDWNEGDQKKYQEILDYLRENFKNYKLYFKPRKTLTDVSKLNLRGFEILAEDVPLEEVCLRKNIVKVIAIKSTSTKVGAYFGISSYLLYPLFNFSESIRSILERYFEDMVSIRRVNKLEDLKKEIPIKNNHFNQLASLYWEAIIK